MSGGWRVCILGGVPFFRGGLLGFWLRRGGYEMEYSDFLLFPTDYLLSQIKHPTLFRPNHLKPTVYPFLSLNLPSHNQ